DRAESGSRFKARNGVFVSQKPLSFIRMKMNTMTSSSRSKQYVATVAAACRTIEAAEELPSLDALAKTAGMSRFHFHRVFSRIVGLTPKAFAAAHRAERMRQELPRRKTVTEAIYGAGFNSNGRFYAESSQM